MPDWKALRAEFPLLDRYIYLGVIVDSRPGRVRLSPHWCVTDDELDRGMDLVLSHLGAATPGA
jgi:hypothetical protein